MGNTGVSAEGFDVRKRGAALVYLHGDHPSTSLGAGLGSASLATSMTGMVLSQQRYKPGACPFASLRASCGLVVTVPFVSPPANCQP